MVYLDDLLERLANDGLRAGVELPKGVSFQSDLTVAWEAWIEAKNLSDPQLIPPLMKSLEKEKETKKRINIINVLVPLADKNDDQLMADYMLKLIKKEKVKWIKDVALSALIHSKLEIKEETEFLFELVNQKVYPAIDLLSRLDSTYSQRIEQLCLEQIEINKKNPYVLTSICHVLHQHGTIESIKSIQNIARTNSKAFTVNAALATLAKLDGLNGLDFFIEMFENNKIHDVKSMSTQVLCKFGDEKIIHLLIKRAKDILSKARKSNVIYVGGSKPELVHILEFLCKYKDERVGQLIHLIATKKMGLMDETELKWFNEQIKTA